MINILLLSNVPMTLALMRAASDAFECTLDAFADANELNRKLEKHKDSNEVVVIMELGALADASVRLANACALVRRRHAITTIGLIASAIHHIDEATQLWATESGADVIVGQINPWRWAATGEALLTALLQNPAAVAAASRRVSPYLRAAISTASTNLDARLIAEAEARGIDLPALAFRMQRSGGVNIQDRRYRLRIYPECFVASEAVTWLERGLRVPREQAILIGQALQAAGLIYHVAKEQTFADAELFFRVARLSRLWTLERFYASIRSEAGFSVLDRNHSGNRYGRCFIGSEAVDWMQAQGDTLNEAMSMGQRLIDLSLAHHVLDEHSFKNEKLFYRFYRDE